ncbi:hypothetical protein AO262_08375 [Pseudomonas fluorescens ABAC62]|nr:hypothetical protein AO262_08375 [Pseudomonas fluorescens ABAC62]
MADLGTAPGGEKQQVAGLQVLLTDVLGTHHDQLARGAWQGNTSGVAVHKADQAAAVKPRVRRVAAPAVRRTDQAQRTEEHVFGSRREILGGIVEHRLGLDCDRRRWRWSAGASTEQYGANEKSKAG